MKRWKVLASSKSKVIKAEEIVDLILKNRGLKTKSERKEFINPTSPYKISLSRYGIKSTGMNKAIKRIVKAKKDEEKVIILGDYDADGMCGATILWECFTELGIDTMPFIPDRFSEGYGLNKVTITNLQKKYPDVKLVISVDNGIVAYEGCLLAKKLGIDVIITDHHQLGRKLPKALAFVHTTEISGAAVAWVFAKEIGKKLKKASKPTGLELAGVGTIADQLPLLGVNRSFAKYGLDELNVTKRAGLLALFQEARLKKGSIGVYDINFVIAPRLNAPGRLTHGIESMRLLCVKDKGKTQVLAKHLGKINYQRQQIVDKVVIHAKAAAGKSDWQGVIVLAHKSYHEGVVGLAASRIVEKYYRPAIVLSKGKKISKASARSISGFNIIKVIRKLDNLLINVGGHPMAAGFSIKTENIDKFTKKLTKLTTPLLTNEILSRKLKIDVEIDFGSINWKLVKEISKLGPNGIGNPTPTFVTFGVNVLNAKPVGREGNHLKLTLENKDKVFDAIAFSFGKLFLKMTPGTQIDLVYSLEENVWANKRSIQIKVKDIKTKS